MTLITYPACPLSGGRLGLVPKPRVHLWSATLNGWRAPIHAPTGIMWNRRGEPLTIADEFTDALEDLSRSRLTWLDCEALERRHNLGRGSLILLDVIVPDLPATDRCRLLLEEATRLGWPVLNVGNRPDVSIPLLNHAPALTSCSADGVSVDTLLPVWLNATSMSGTQNQCSPTSAATSSGGASKAISYQ
jgi:hypothetical protein